MITQTLPIKSNHTEEKVEFGRLLFSKKCKFILGCVSLEQIPNLGLAEVAFAGRSNVGKSSLINALINHKSMARASNTPGRTREINFFSVGETLTIADLPGYGYARVAKSQVKQWTKLIHNYLKGRAELQRTFVLIDARRGIKEIDYSFISMLDKAAQSYQLVFTKCDKTNAKEIEPKIKTYYNDIQNHPAAIPEICQTSIKTGAGISNLRSIIAALTVSNE